MTAKASPATRRILLAEDNRVNSRIALRLLERLGYDAHLSTTGTEVLEVLAHQTYDVVLMDVEMPDMDGLEATRSIRRRAGARPYIVALTASTEPGDREACRAAGMDDYLSKPLDPDSLVVVLERAWMSLERAAVPDDCTPNATGGASAGDRPLDPEPVVDPAVAQRLAEALGERGPTVVAHLVHLFLTGAPGLLRVLHDERSATGAALDDVRRAAHSLRSEAAALGARRLTAACRDLEVAARAGDGRPVPGLVDRVASEYASARPVLEALGRGSATKAPG